MDVSFNQLVHFGLAFLQKRIHSHRVYAIPHLLTDRIHLWLHQQYLLLKQRIDGPAAGPGWRHMSSGT